MICRENDSICDVGSCGVDMISHLQCKKKMSIDLNCPVNCETVEGITGDFLTYDIGKHDIITCFQVLEHIDDEKIDLFVERLLNFGKIIVISVPYKWKKGMCKSHLQDPVDLKKVLKWFKRKPLFIHKIAEKNGLERMILAFKNEQSIEILSDELIKELEEIFLTA